MADVCVRYFVDDVDGAIGFYSELLGFEVDDPGTSSGPAPGWARFRSDIGVGRAARMLDDPPGTQSSSSSGPNQPTD